jgi:phage gpG-like protein
MATISLQFDDADAQRKLSSAVQQLEHPQPLMEAIGRVLRGNIERRFDTKTDPTGAAWAPITETTKQFWTLLHGGPRGRARKPGKEDWKAFGRGDIAASQTMPGSLLERTRAMRGSLTHNSSDLAAEVGFNRATDGGAWQVAMLHEFGTKSMPRRGLMTADPKTGKLGATDEADVIGAMDDWLSRLFD